jgi:hypothetical protein
MTPNSYDVSCRKDPSETRITNNSSGENSFSPRRLCSSRFWALRSRLCFLCSLRGKATAVEDPASVTDEVPARVSAGHDGPVDSGLTFSTSSIFRVNGRNQRTISPVLFCEGCVNGVRLLLEFSDPSITRATPMTRECALKHHPTRYALMILPGEMNSV